MICHMTFEDGSTAVLSHYGVKGMKWGVWNAETKARYADAGNGTYYKKATRGTKFSQAVTNQRRAYNANQPKSKQIVKNILLGPGGAHAYNTARSRGLSRSEALANSSAGVLYAQGVKYKQKKLNTTKPKISGAAKERSEYAKDESLKKTVAKTLLLNVSGSIAYNTVKARTKSRGKAILAAMGASTASNVYGNDASIAGTYALTRAIGDRKYDQQTDALKYKIRKPETKKNGKQRW